MPSSTRSNSGVPEIRLPLRRCRSARVTLVMAWVAFWLNSALFPCCEAFAAAFDEHSDDVSQSVAVAQPAHHSDETNSERPHHSPDSPCDYKLDAGPAISGEYAGLPTDRVPLEWIAPPVPTAVGLTAGYRFAILAPRDYRPHLPTPLLAFTCTLSAC